MKFIDELKNLAISKYPQSTSTSTGFFYTNITPNHQRGKPLTKEQIKVAEVLLEYLSKKEPEIIHAGDNNVSK